MDTPYGTEDAAQQTQKVCVCVCVSVCACLQYNYLASIYIDGLADEVTKTMSALPYGA
jgi:hypothetical protein